GEAPWDGAVREAPEETGLRTRPVALLGYAEIELVGASGGAVTMPNYTFLLDPSDPEAEPVPAGDEGVRAVRTVPLTALAASAGALLGLEGRWRNWGRYRAISHGLACLAIRDRYAWS